MAGRPKLFNREQVLEKSILLFWEKGYENTSTAELLEVVQLNKGSLYNEFNSKKELFIEGLKYLEEKALQNLESNLAASDTPVEVIKSLFYGVLNASPEQNCKGCILGNTIMEFAGQQKDIVDIAGRYIKQLERLFVTYIQKAKENGSFSGLGTAEDIGKYLINFWNGINISRRIYQDDKVLKEMIDFHLRILN